MDIARSAGRRVAFSLSDGFCVERHRADFVALVEDRLDIVFANRDEICSLYEVDDFEQAMRPRARRHRARVRHPWRAGLGRRRRRRALRRARVIPSTIWSTRPAPAICTPPGVLFGLTNGHDLETSARLGSLAAAEVISHLGARPEISLAELAKTI